MRRTILTVSAVLALTIVHFGPDLRAYATNGHAWGASTVNYYVNPDNLYVPAASAISAVQTAAAVWNTQAGIPLQLTYGGQTTANTLSLDYTNNVFFRNDSSGYIAETYWWWDGSGKLVDADIVLHENYKFYTGNVGCPGDGYYVESVVTHEIGHALGLAHSTVGTATMYPSSNACDTSFETLDPDDVSGIQSLYPAGSTTTTTTGSTTTTRTKGKKR